MRISNFQFPNFQKVNPQSGFTLLELIIVIAILSILSVAVVLVINPAEMLRRARDSQRLSDLAALSSAINLAAVEQSSSGSWSPNTQEADGCADEANPLVYVSVPVAEAAPDDLPSGWGYKQPADASAAGRVNGTGWVPVDLTSGGGNSPLSNLPQDPVNSFTDNAYYTYVCTRNPTFELTARMESNRYRTGGSEDKAGGDGGDDPFAYEVGSNLGIDPKAPIMYLDAANWDGIDTITDSSGNGHDAVAVGGGATIPTPGSDSTGNFLTFDGGDYLDVADHADLDFAVGDDLTLMAVRRNYATGQEAIVSKSAVIGTARGYVLYRWTTNTWMRIDDGTAAAEDGYSEAANGVVSVVAGVRNTTDDDVEGFNDGVGSGSPTPDLTTTTLANSLPLRIGATSAPTPVNFFDGDIYAVGLWRRAMTDEEVAAISEVLRP